MSGKDLLWASQKPNQTKMSKAPRKSHWLLLCNKLSSFYFLEREIPSVEPKDSLQLLRPSWSSAKQRWDNPGEGRWDNSAVVGRGSSIVHRLLSAPWIMRFLSVNLHSGCWMNSVLKVGISCYSFILHTRLILGLYPALEHLHLLIFRGAAAFPLLKDAPCQKKMVYTNCWCL